MRVILAEKPSVAQSIAAVLGADQKKNGYLQGENDIVSWCIGHLIELAPPEIYDARYAKWRREDLPIVPSAWESVVSDGTKKQFAVLKDLLNRTDVDEVVCAKDAGREGELIFRMVYEKTGCTKPVKRLWISSLEESAIRDGFRSLKPDSAYDALYRAALCRARADWLVGINGTRLYSRLYGTKLNVGRVMTPTLAMVAQREREIAAFQVEPFYTVQLSCGFPAQSERMKTREEAEQIRAACHCKKAAVKQIERRQKKEKPPKLYDLTALQRDANRIYGYTAQQTLDYAQTLYEKKLATYPRTDSRFLTHDLRDRLPALIECVAQVLPFANGLPLAVHADQVICDEKVSDHHAIIPTQNMTREALAQLPMGERSILTLLAVRLLAATGEPCETDEVTVTLDCEGHDFTAKGSTVRQMGYRMFEETFRGSLGSRERKEQEYPIPPLFRLDTATSPFVRPCARQIPHQPAFPASPRGLQAFPAPCALHPPAHPSRPPFPSPPAAYLRCNASAGSSVPRGSSLRRVRPSVRFQAAGWGIPALSALCCPSSREMFLQTFCSPSVAQCFPSP